MRQFIFAFVVLYSYVCVGFSQSVTDNEKKLIEVPAISEKQGHKLEKSGKNMRAKLHFDYRIKKFYVSPNGNVYIYYCDSKNIRKDKYILYSANLKSQTWSAEELKFLSNGYISDHNFGELKDGRLIFGCKHYSHDSHSFYLSNDGRTSYKRVGPRVEGCFYEVWTDGENKVRAVTGLSELFSSDDAGKTWSKSYFFDNPDDRRNSYQYDLYFDPDGLHGWICADDNNLIYTPDGGKSFQHIPTPYIQHPMKFPPEESDNVHRFRHIGKHYFLYQNGNHFYTSADSINWQKVDSISWFGRSGDGPLLVISSSNLVAYDENLHVLWKQPMHEISGHYCVCKDKLYVLTPNNDIYIIGKGSIYCVPMFSDKDISYSPDELKNIIHMANGHDFMLKDGDITCRDTPSSSWYNIVCYPFSFSSFWIDGDSTLCLADENNRKFKVDYDNHRLVPLSSDLSALNKLGVESFALINREWGYPMGCLGPYVNYSEVAAYTRNGDDFVRSDKSILADFFKKYSYLDVKNDTLGWTHKSSKFNDMPAIISKADVDELKGLVLNAMVGVPDTFTFQITAEDMAEFKQDLNNESHTFDGQNEKKYYRYFADSVNTDTFSMTFLHDIFSDHSTIWYGASSKSRLFLFKLSNGKYLIVSNINFKTNYLGLPYVAYYGEEPFEIKNANVGIKLNDITKGLFLPMNRKVDGIQQIAKYMFKNQ